MFSSILGLYPLQFSSVGQSCPTLFDPVDCSTPGLLVHHQLLEFTQTSVHWVGDAIQPSHPLSSPFPLTFNLSQHQGLFKWVSSSHQVAKVLEFQFQHHIVTTKSANMFGRLLPLLNFTDLKSPKEITFKLKSICVNRKVWKQTLVSKCKTNI